VSPYGLPKRQASPRHPMAPGFDDRECRLSGLWTLQNRCEHVEAFFRKGFWHYAGMLQFAEPVEIFHQFQFFGFVEFQNVTFGKFVGIVGNGLVHITSSNTINFGNIAINQDTLSTKFHYRIVNATYIKWFIHFLLFTSYLLPATADFVGFPYQSDFFSDRQNFFETPSTRTKTSSSEGGVECPESSVECVWEGIPFINLLNGSEGFRSDLDNGGKGTQGIIHGF
jgi:hypothetical protein